MKMTIATFKKLIKQIKTGESALNEAAQGAAMQALNGNLNWLTDLVDATRTPAGRVGATCKDWASYVTSYTNGIAFDAKTGTFSFTSKERALKSETGEFPETLAEYLAKRETQRLKAEAEKAEAENANNGNTPTASDTPAPAPANAKKQSAKALLERAQKLADALTMGVSDKSTTEDLKALVEATHAAFTAAVGILANTKNVDVDAGMVDFIASADLTNKAKAAGKKQAI